MNKLVKPYISVVIPMYNVEDYIRTSLESVLNQTFEEFEVICVDDGGSDKSVEIVSKYDDPRIRIVSQKNRGLAGARNTGIHNARAAFVAFLDADDYWHPEKLEEHFKHLCENPNIGVSYSQSRFIDDNGKLLSMGQYPKLKGVTRQHILCRNPVGNGSAPVIRRLALLDVAFEQEVDGEIRSSFFNEKLRQSEDIEMWVRMALNTQWQFGGIGRELTFYRVNASGLSANLDKQYRSWREAMDINYAGNECFFEKWLPLADAYQKRYLARRAIQCGQGTTAISLVLQAISKDFRIVAQEPLRTAVTTACAFLALLPSSVYLSIQSIAMNLMKGYKV